MEKRKPGQFRDMEIKNLKPELKEYWRREGQGFSIRVLPSGEKLWYYIYTFEGKKRFMRLGEGNYPDVSIATARGAFEAARKRVSNGFDPLAEKEALKRDRRNALTVAELVAEYIEKYAKVEKKTWTEDKRCLEKEVIPLWGKLKAEDITRRDVRLLLEGIVERGSPVMSNNTFEKIRKMFNYAEEKDIVKLSPCYGVKKLTKTEPKERVLNDTEIITFWNGIDSAPLSDEIRKALKLILVTAQRPGEVIGLHSREVEGNWWTVPVERAKNGKAHRVFLTPTAKEIIGNKEGFIFESPRPVKVVTANTVSYAPKAIHVNAVSCAVRRCLEEPKDEKQGEELTVNEDEKGPTKNLRMKSWTPHDLRRTAATRLSELRYTDAIIDAILNHIKKGIIATYNKNNYDIEKQEALEAWERKLKSIVTPQQAAQQPDNVIPFKRGAKR